MAKRRRAGKSKVRKVSKVSKVRRKTAAASPAVAAPRPFLFVSGGKSRKGFTMAKRRSGKRRGGGGLAGGVGSFFGKPVLFTVGGAALASAFGPRIRAMLPASFQTGGGLLSSALVAFGGGYLISRFVSREAGAGFAAGTLAPEIGGMFSVATAGRAAGMRGLPGESTGVSYLPEMAGLGADEIEEMAGVDDDEMSGFESDALEV
jgi:hypothetical protein